MEQYNLNFLGKDRERLGEVSRLFNSAEDRADFLKAVKDAAAMEGSDQQKRDFVLKTLLSAPKSRQYLKVAMPDFYKEGLKAERGEGWKMSMKDIEKATQATEEELLNPETGWMGSKTPMDDMKFMIESEGLDYKDVVKMLQEAQTKKNIKDMWYANGLPSRFAMSFIAPFESEKLSSGEPVSEEDVYKDIGMGAATVFPWGKAAGLVSGLSARVAPSVAKYPLVARGLRYGSEFAGPGIVEGAMTEGDLLDKLYAGVGATGGNATAGALIAGGSQFMKSWANDNANKALKDIEDALKETIYPEEIKMRLNAIKSTLKSKPENLTDSDLALLRTVENLKILKKGNPTKLKLGDIGGYNKDKYTKYRTQVDKDPIAKANRDDTKARLDEYEQIAFENNPGKITFSDWMATSPNKAEVGFGVKAGLGKPRIGLEEGKPHPLISDDPRYDMNYWLAEREKKMKAHTDQYYPRSTALDDYMDEFLKANPEVNILIDNGKISRQDIADLLRKRLYPSIYTHGKSGLVSRNEKESNEKQ